MRGKNGCCKLSTVRTGSPAPKDGHRVGGGEKRAAGRGGSDMADGGEADGGEVMGGAGTAARRTRG